MKSKSLRFNKLPAALLYLALTLMSLAGGNAFAGEWQLIRNVKGVDIFCRVDQELKDQFCSKLKMVNHNSYPVEVRLKAGATMRDGRVWKERTASHFTLKPGQSKGGNWGGMFYYPFGGEEPPRSVGWSYLTIERDR